MFAALTVVCCLAIAFGPQSVSAQVLTSGTSGRKFKAQTIESLPMSELNEVTQQKLLPVLNKPSIYRRLPVTAVQTDPDYFRYLIRYPEVVVEIWKLMGVTEMDVTRTAPYVIDSDDGAGTISQIELVYGSDELHIFYAEGTYEGPVLKRKLNGRCVLVLRTQHKVDAQGKPQAVNQLDVFLKVDNATAGLVARTLQPMVGSTADHNFSESLKFFQKLNETTERNGPGVQSMAERLDLTPEVRKQFQDIAGLVYQRANQATTRASQPQPRVSQSAPLRQPPRQRMPAGYR